MVVHGVDYNILHSHDKSSKKHIIYPLLYAKGVSAT